AAAEVVSSIMNALTSRNEAMVRDVSRDPRPALHSYTNDVARRREICQARGRDEPDLPHKSSIARPRVHKSCNGLRRVTDCRRCLHVCIQTVSLARSADVLQCSRPDRTDEPLPAFSAPHREWKGL